MIRLLPVLIALAVVAFAQASAEPTSKAARLKIAVSTTQDLAALKPCVEVDWDGDAPLEVLGWKEGDECWTTGDLTVLDVAGKEIGAYYYRGNPVVTETFRLSRGETLRFHIYSMSDPDILVDGDYDAVVMINGESGGRQVYVTTDRVRFHFAIATPEKPEANKPPEAMAVECPPSNQSQAPAMPHL